jgi:hypothetical protein
MGNMQVGIHLGLQDKQPPATGGAIQLAEMAIHSKLAEVLAARESEMGSIRTNLGAEVRIRRYGDRRHCDVVVVAYGKEMILKCPDFAQAVKWARLECKTYRIESGFSVAGSGDRVSIFLRTMRA